MANAAVVFRPGEKTKYVPPGEEELSGDAAELFAIGQKAEKEGNLLKYSREYKMQTTQVPLERIEQLRKLFSQIGTDEKNMAVLKKAN